MHGNRRKLFHRLPRFQQEVISEIQQLVLQMEDRTGAWFRCRPVPRTIRGIPPHGATESIDMFDKTTNTSNQHPSRSSKTKNRAYILDKLDRSRVDDPWEFMLDETIGDVKMGHMHGPFAAPDWWPRQSVPPSKREQTNFLPLPHHDPSIALSKPTAMGKRRFAEVKIATQRPQFGAHHRPTVPPHSGPLCLAWIGFPQT